MSDAAREPDEPAAKPADARRAEPSFGNMGEHHWSRARAGTNAEALDYYRARSKAPGVAEGGGARNFYCMACDGVIDADAGHARCPHCGAELEGMARRYFNWVEINEPPKSDLRALLPFLIAGVVLAAVAGWILWRFVLLVAGAYLPALAGAILCGFVLAANAGAGA